MNRQLIEIASWRIVSELFRRYPSTFRLIETHPGGGLYDCLSLYDAGMRHIADFNRQGRFHVFNRFDQGKALSEPLEIWDHMINAEDPRTVLDQISTMMGLPVPGKLPHSQPDTIAFRWIASFLTHAAFGREKWECRNGVLDTSGFGGGIRPFFEMFPDANKRLDVSMPTDLLSTSAYRFWFIIRNEVPLLCVEAEGHVWDERGNTFNLADLYKKERRIWPLVVKIAGHMLH
jgi:hypothetical protein